MPSSIGHALAGYATVRLVGGRLRSNWPHVLAATAPDLDIIFGILRDRPIDYRNRYSHSACSSLAAGLVLGGFALMAGRSFVANALIGTAAYASHLALDYFGKEAEDGLPLLWPFSNRRLAADRPVFRTIYSRRGGFFTGLITRRNLRKMGREVVILAPVVAASTLIGKIAG